MKLCIPVKFPEGLESHIEPHLPHAEHLVFFDTESRCVESVSLREPKPGDERYMDFDAVLCGSISRVVLRTLGMQGVSVYGTAAQTVVQAVEQFEQGELVVADPEATPSGGCGSGHAHGEGGCGGGGCGGGGCGHGEQEHDHDHEHHGHCQGQGGCGGHGEHHDHDDHHGHAHEGGCCGRRRAAPRADAPEPLGDEFSIAVCSQNRKTVTEHAGKCRKFWVYQIRHGQVVGKTLLELPIEQAFHSAPVDEPHPLDGVSVVIGGTMGDGLKQRLAGRGIAGIVTEVEAPDDAVAAFLEGVFGESMAAAQ